MKQIIFSFLFFLNIGAFAQCPYIIGVLADADASGTPTGEGKNEFLAFNTGGSSVAVNTLYFSYSVSTTTTNYAIDGTTASPSVWTSLATPSLITNSIGTITVVTSGSIPANKNVVVIPSTNTISYDLKTFGTNVYVLPYNATAGSPRVVGYAAAGNFANSGGAARYIRIRQGASCRDTVSYIPSSLPGGDGGGAKWSASKVITYINSGGSGAVLPIELLNIQGSINKGQKTIEWYVSGSSTALYFEVEKSKNGSLFKKIGTVNANQMPNVEGNKYSFTDNELSYGVDFYRFKSYDIEGNEFYSPTITINYPFPSNHFNIYPNPAQSQLYIYCADANLDGQVMVMDLCGRVVDEKKLSVGNNNIDVSGLASGTYMLRIRTDNEVETYKFIKE